MLGNKAKRPVNRFTGFKYMEFTRQNGDVTTNIATARKWYENGNKLKVVLVAHVFALPRNQSLRSAMECSGMYVRETRAIICTPDRKQYKRTHERMYSWDILETWLANIEKDVNYNLF